MTATRLSSKTLATAGFFIAPVRSLKRLCYSAVLPPTDTTVMQQDLDRQRFRAFSGKLDESLLQSLEGMGYEYI